MIIKEIELFNFRIYKGINKIEMNPDKDKNIFIVSGRNGFGKTTFLMSLVWCLYGRHMEQVDDLYQKEIADQGGYSKYIKNSLNRLAKSEEDHFFYVSVTFSRLNIPDLPCKEIQITRGYNALTSSSDQIKILVDGHESDMVTDIGAEYFIRDYILPNEIAKFFFFDAEKIVTLAEINTPEQRKKLSLAYSEVLGIKKYEDLKRNLEELQLKLKQDSASQKEKEEIRILQVKVDSCNESILEHELQLEEIKEKIQERRKESNDIQEKLIRAGSTITVEELNVLREHEAKYNTKLNELQDELKDQFDIIPFAIAGEKFLNVSKQIESESNFRKVQYQQENVEHKIDKMLGDVLSAERPPNLVIDRKTHDFYYSLFDQLLHRHLCVDAQQFDANFEIIHDYSDSERDELNALLSNVKASFKETFKRINGDANQTKNELNNTRKKIRDAETNQEDSIIATDRKRKEDIDKEVIRLESDTSDINQAIGEKRNEIVQKKKRIEEISRKLSVSEANKAKDELVTRQIAELRDFIIRFKEQKKKSLEEQILNGLNTLMHKKGFVNRVKVDIIGDVIDIVLYNIRNEEIKKESLSKGEQQMYATALLRALVEESDIEFPVFIDSPMQKFDEHHAQNIIKYFYPNVSDQVIIFPLIKKELTDKEFTTLSKNIKQCYLIHNVHEDKSKFIPVAPEAFLETYETMYANAN